MCSDLLKNLWKMLTGQSGTTPITTVPNDAPRQKKVETLHQQYGITLVETDPKGNARPWQPAELNMLLETLNLLGPAFYAPFLARPIHTWIDRNPGGGGYADSWLRLGEPGDDLSVLYRVFLHEATHASNEHRGWPYENQFCTRPGLDWYKDGDTWRHPRQQGQPFQPGEWETLPVDARDVSVAPGEDLAETVRYFVHSVRQERAWLWPLDQNQPPTYLWDTSPTRFVYVRDHFLELPETHRWYRRLSQADEARAATNLAAST